MCGIAGIVSLSDRPISDARSRLSAMISLLNHRGPDGAGLWVSEDGLVGLANTRLSIVGVHDSFDLPMRSTERGDVLTFNGEIYNYRELRAQLAAHGARFRTGTDTEVLLAGLSSEGPEFVQRADGVWSFGFFDERSRVLHLARDLMGEKSLFYAVTAGELVFASEIPPILAAAQESPTWDFDSVVCAFQYRAAPPGRTLLNEVRRLRAGFCLTVTPGSSDLRQRRLQRLAPEKWQEFFARDPGLDEVVEAFEEQIQRACDRRVPAEVDYISTLSGGIDSALVNVFLSNRGTRRITTLYGHSTRQSPQRGTDLSEYDASCLTAQRLDTDHQAFSMYSDDAVAVYAEEAANSFDGVFCEGATQFRLLARQARSAGKRVLITSDGPDELFAGYDVDIRAVQLGARFAQCDDSVRRALMRRASDVEHMRGKSSALLNWAYTAGEPFAVRPNHGGTRPEVMATLFGPVPAAVPVKSFGRVDDDYADLVQGMDTSQKMGMAYACTSLPDYVNTRSDRGTMRESIELRLPLQATYLAELMVASPAKWRIRNGTWSKFILRCLVQRYIGDAVAFRGKYGFARPIWMIPEQAAKLDMREVVAGSAIFHAVPFEPKAREFVLSPGQERHLWMAYCLAQTYERLTNEFAPAGKRSRFEAAALRG